MFSLPLENGDTFIVKGELSSARSGEIDTEPLSIVINLLSLSYNAA
jgi:hypothetical protein